MGSIMKRKILFLVGIIVVLIVGFVIVKFVSGAGQKQGELRVDSQPAVSVFLDNKHIGRSPYKDKVNVGEYTIKLVPDSGVGAPVSWQGKITVGGNLLTYVNSTLSDSELTTAVDLLWLEKISSKKSEISVTTNPDGATVLIDNETKGITPLTVSDMSAGDHTLTINSPGFVSRTLKLKTTAGYKLIASVKLALSGEVIPTPTQEATPSPSLTGKLTPTPKTTGTPKPTPTKIATSSGTIKDPPKPFVIIKDTPTGFLRVREETNTSANELGRVNPGEKYSYFDSKTATGSSTLWYQIKYDGKNTGWISGQYAEKVE